MATIDSDYHCVTMISGEILYHGLFFLLLEGFLTARVEEDPLDIPRPGHLQTPTLALLGGFLLEMTTAHGLGTVRLPWMVPFTSSTQ